MTKQEVNQMDKEAQGVEPVLLPKGPMTGLALLREPFTPNQISKLPKPTAAQTKKVKDDYKQGIRCDLCGAWHHKDVVHLDYVGHAALTDRLLDCDENWNWEPVAKDEHGRPIFDSHGGMWINLTVCDQTRLGYGDAAGKSGPNAVKEVIGDALRNAAMRFGAALDLWHKGDLHAIADEAEIVEPKPKFDADGAADRVTGKLERADSLDDLRHRWNQEQEVIQQIRDVSASALSRVERAKDDRKAALEKIASDFTPDTHVEINGDEIPYDGPSA